MHFSRNPPGPNTSRIEAFALAAPFSAATPGVSNFSSGRGRSSSTGTYLRSTVFADCRASPAVVSLLALPAFLTRSSPSRCATSPQSCYDSIPAALPHRPRSLPPESSEFRILLVLRPLALEQRSAFWECSSRPIALDSFPRGVRRFPFGDRKRNAICRGVSIMVRFKSLLCVSSLLLATLFL